MVRFIPNAVVDIHEEAVQSYIRPGGEVSEELWKVVRDTRDDAKLRVAVRSGRLKRGIGANRPQLEGPLQGVARAYSSARHTLWYHDGTGENGTRTIRSAKRGWNSGMYVPVNQRAAHTLYPKYAGAGTQTIGTKSGPAFFADEVMGQRAKPFLEEAFNASRAKHGYL